MILTYKHYRVEGIYKLENFNILVDTIKHDTNCARMLIGKTWDQVISSETQFTSLYVNSVGVGIIMIDPPAFKYYQCHHICMFETNKNRDDALILTQLAVQLSLMKGIKPFTTVMNTPKFSYMHKFLYECGFTNELPADSKICWYVTPKDWHVPSLDHYIVSK